MSSCNKLNLTTQTLRQLRKIEIVLNKLIKVFTQKSFMTRTSVKGPIGSMFRHAREPLPVPWFPINLLPCICLLHILLLLCLRHAPNMGAMHVLYPHFLSATQQIEFLPCFQLQTLFVLVLLAFGSVCVGQVFPRLYWMYVLFKKELDSFCCKVSASQVGSE